jgi:hypothetical protein
VALLDGEETGALGSAHHAAQLRAAGATPLVINVDGAGYLNDAAAVEAGGPALFDLFEGRSELAVYQFMDNGPDDFCPGCTAFTNNVPGHALEMLANRGISWATVSNMPLAQIEAYKGKMGWTMPFVVAQHHVRGGLRRQPLHAEHVPA